MFISGLAKKHRGVLNPDLIRIKSGWTLLKKSILDFLQKESEIYLKKIKFQEFLSNSFN